MQPEIQNVWSSLDQNVERIPHGEYSDYSSCSFVLSELQLDELN